VLYRAAEVNHFIIIKFSFSRAHANNMKIYFLITRGRAKARRVSSLKNLQNLKYAKKNTTTYSEIAHRSLVPPEMNHFILSTIPFSTA
jgi:hypothetical protein